MAKDKQNNERKFPLGRLSLGAFLGGVLASGHYMSSVSSVSIVGSFVYFAVLAFLIGVIPMSIAYARNTQNANKVYWFAFAAMCAPGGIIWLITSLLMAILGKKHD